MEIFQHNRGDNLGQDEVTVLLPGAKGSENVPKVVIVGSGLSGLVAGMFMARRQFKVDIFDRRKGPCEFAPTLGRSMNLTLCERGLRILEKINLRDAVISETVELHGRTKHYRDGTDAFEKYGRDAHEVLYAIRRSDLMRILLEGASHYPNLSLHFDSVFERAATDERVATFNGNDSNFYRREKYDLLVGADGVFSKVRRQMSQNGEERKSKWKYKELTIRAGSPLSLRSLHVWAREQALFIAIPNVDRSFTGNFFYHEGELERSHQGEFFKTVFADVVPFIPALDSQLSRPGCALISVSSAQWIANGSIALVGDSCHAVLPFLGQGVNAAFEDGFELSRLLGDDPRTWPLDLNRYAQIRRPNGEALAELVERHFPSLKSEAGGYATVVTSLCSRLVRPGYSLVSHTDIPYEKIVKLLRWRRTLLRTLSLGSAILILSILRFLV